MEELVSQLRPRAKFIILTGHNPAVMLNNALKCRAPYQRPVVAPNTARPNFNAFTHTTCIIDGGGGQVTSGAAWGRLTEPMVRMSTANMHTHGHIFGGHEPPPPHRPQLMVQGRASRFPEIEFLCFGKV